MQKSFHPARGAHRRPFPGTSAGKAGRGRCLRRTCPPPDTGRALPPEDVSTPCRFWRRKLAVPGAERLPSAPGRSSLPLLAEKTGRAGSGKVPQRAREVAPAASGGGSWPCRFRRRKLVVPGAEKVPSVPGRSSLPLLAKKAGPAASGGESSPCRERRRPPACPGRGKKGSRAQKWLPALPGGRPCRFWRRKHAVPGAEKAASVPGKGKKGLPGTEMAPSVPGRLPLPLLAEKTGRAGRRNGCQRSREVAPAASGGESWPCRFRWRKQQAVPGAEKAPSVLS